MQEFSANQIKRMEQEATKRAKEYNSRAKPTANNMKEKEAKEPVNKPMPKKQKKGALSFLNALDIKKLIGENSEQAMLLLLILILSNENSCDEYLIYALIYIML